MKRDMDLVREILFKVEESDYPLKAEKLITKEHDANTIAHHLNVMASHGLIETTEKFTVYNGGEDVTGTIRSLTWEGYDYLDAIRNHGIWQKTKEAIAQSVGSTTIEIFKETAKLIAMQTIKAQVGVV